MPGSELAVENRPHYTNQKLTRNPHYRGRATIWSPEEALAVMRELLEYFDGIPVPPPPTGLPGRNGSVERTAFNAIRLGAEYMVAVIEGRPGRQWDLYSAMEGILLDEYQRGVRAEKAASVSARTKQAADDYAAWERGEPLPGFAYFIAGDDGAIKIGTALDVAKRLKGLQTSHPTKLSVLASVPGGRGAEQDYHARFAEHRLHGEWFARHPDILAEIDRLNTGAVA